MRLKQGLLFFTIVILAVIVFFAYDFRQFINTPLSTSETVHLDVTPGSSITSIANELTYRGRITRPEYLVAYARYSGNAIRIQAGDYAIPPGTTPKQLLEILVKGKVRQYSFTIIEGWNLLQVLEAVRKNKNLTHQLKAVTAENLIGQLGGPSDMHAEGWLFPDTYYHVRGESDRQLLTRAYQAMKKNLGQAWQQREKQLPYKTPYEALIMASIVEKETGRGEERSQIAGVFVRRLRKGMKLQTDPTVIYGIGENYDGNIRRKDLRRDTPYNTYTRRGLPPTPIAMPGRAAIDAALHPAKGKSLYFVAKGDGSHVFSETLEQHNEAVIKYQLKGRRKAFSSFSTQDKK